MLTAADTLTLSELVAGVNPLLLYDYHEALDRAIVRVDHDLCKRDELRSTVPPIAAVNENVNGLHSESRCNLSRPLNDGNDVIIPRGGFKL